MITDGINGLSGLVLAGSVCSEILELSVYHMISR